MSKPICIDLFCGAGGTSLGFKKAGFEMCISLDIDSNSCNTYAKNLHIDPINSDLHNIDSKDLLKIAGLNKGDLDVLVGCPPCQGFTRLRPKCHNDERNELVIDYARKVREIWPKIIVFENVPGLLLPKASPYYNGFLAEIHKMGYQQIGGVLQAADYGVPQLRKRLIIIAARDKFKNKIKLPEPTHCQKNKSNHEHNINHWHTVREALEGLPQLKSGQKSSLVPNHIASDHSDKVLKLIKLVPKDGGSRSDLPKRMWLQCHKKHDGHKDVYGRMKLDQPSPCITSGCTNASKGRFIHPIQDRALTPREAARLQTFPDDFIFHGSSGSIASQIGNAMPVLLAEAVAKEVYNIL